MSRSYKKHPIVKRKGYKANFYNRIFRRKEKQNILKGKEPSKYSREVVDDLDVCDRRIHGDEEMPWLTKQEKEDLKEQYKRK